jgi:hypothetical protein
MLLALAWRLQRLILPTRFFIQSRRISRRKIMATTLSSATPNSLIRGQTAAVETYTQALPVFEDMSIRSDLQQIRNEHDKIVQRLKGFVRDLNEKPEETSGTWGYWASLVTGAAKMVGDQTTLAALRTGEEHGINQYESALEDNSVAEDLKAVIRTEFIPACQRHVQTLNALISRLENKR